MGDDRVLSAAAAVFSGIAIVSPRLTLGIRKRVEQLCMEKAGVCLMRVYHD